MRVAFLGSPPFATPILARLLASAHEVRVLVTRPDRPSGRGRKVAASPLVALAEEHGVPVLQPATTKDPAFVAALRAHGPEIVVVASYGEILRTDVLDLAPHGALNVHASLLPRHRGASPIQAAILAGDAETGVSIQRIVLALDEGDVLLDVRTPIHPDENAGELAARLSELGGEATVAALDLLEQGAATLTPQDPALATYAGKIRKEDGTIDWSRTSAELARHVRAMTPWPGARTCLPDGKELVVLAARVADGTGEPGQVLDARARFLVATGDAALELLTVKPAGKGAMDGAAFLRGAHLGAGTRLGPPRRP